MLKKYEENSSVILDRLFSSCCLIQDYQLSMKKKIIGMGIFLCMFLYSCLAQNSERETYIELYKHIAIEEMNRSGIPASIKLAQGILESGSGKSTLAVKANNHFGIKCGGGWSGATYYHFDDDYDRNGNLIKSCFRKYQSPEESYTAHTEFLMAGARYEFLFSYPKTDYKNWARGLKKAGYATNPQYPDLLIKIIEGSDLAKFDRMKEEVIVFEPENPKRPDKVEAVTRRKSVNNQVKIIIAAAGDTYIGLAEILDIPLKKLVKYNDAKPSRVIQQGDYVYTQPKRKKYRYKKDFHIVKKDDTMYRLSQKYGIKLKHLYKRNLMKSGTEAASGQRIYLRKKAKNTPKLRPKGTPVTRPQRPKPQTTPPTETRPSSPPPVRPEPTSPSPTATTKVHIVKSGDTLYNIARKYNITVDILKQLNGLTSNIIKIGQRLKIKA